MPNIKSAYKRMRTSAIANASNVSVRSQISHMRRGLFEAIESGDKQKSTALQREYASALDRAVKKGVLKRNTADRRKGRSAVAIAKLA